MTDLCPCCKQPLPKLNGITISLDTNVAVINGRAVQLTPILAEILSVIVDAAPAVATREQILIRVWGMAESEPTAKSIDVYIHNLRKRLRLLGVRIETIWGRGFRLELTGEAAA